MGEQAVGEAPGLLLGPHGRAGSLRGLGLWDLQEVDLGGTALRITAPYPRSGHQEAIARAFLSLQGESSGTDTLPTGRSFMSGLDLADLTAASFWPWGGWKVCPASAGQERAEEEGGWLLS